MVMKSSEPPEQLLDKVVEQMRNVSIPRMPEVCLPAVSKAKVREDAAEPVGKKGFGRNVIGSYVARTLVGAIAAAVLIAAFFFPWSASGHSAFAQVQEAIRKSKSVVFRIQSFSDGKLTDSRTVSYLPAGLARAESKDRVHIFNSQKQELLTIDHTARTSTIQPVYDVESVKKMLAGVFGQLANVDHLDDVEVSDANRDGKQVRLLRTTWDGAKASVLIDSETNLPVFVEVVRRTGTNGETIRERLDNF